MSQSSLENELNTWTLMMLAAAAGSILKLRARGREAEPGRRAADDRGAAFEA